METGARMRNLALEHTASKIKAVKSMTCVLIKGVDIYIDREKELSDNFVNWRNNIYGPTNIYIS